MNNPEIQNIEAQRQDLRKKTKQVTRLSLFVVVLFSFFFISMMLHGYLLQKIENPNANKHLLSNICDYILTIDSYILIVVCVASVILFIKLAKLSYVVAWTKDR